MCDEGPLQKADSLLEDDLVEAVDLVRVRVRVRVRVGVGVRVRGLVTRSTSAAEPMHSAVRWSMPVILTSSTEPPVTPSEVLPPAASTR